MGGHYMYTVEFLPKEQTKTFDKFLRKNKVGKGKLLRLSDCENLIQSYQNQFRQYDQVALRFRDADSSSDDEKKQVYDFILPVEADKTFSLLDTVGKDLDSEVGKNNLEFFAAVKVKDAISLTFQIEQEQMPERETYLQANGNQQNTQRKNGFLGKIFRKINLVEESTSSFNDNQGNNDFTDDEQTKFEEPVNRLSDFEEMDEKDMETKEKFFDQNEIEEFEKEAQAVLENQVETSEENELDSDGVDTSMVYGEEQDHHGLENEFEENPEQNLDILYEGEKKVKEEPVSKFHEVVFPSLDDYLDLRECDPKIQRYEKRFSSKHLMNLLGIDGENVSSELEKRKLAYAKQKIHSTDFILLEDEYHQELKNTADEIRLELSHALGQTMRHDYEKEAEIELGMLFEEQEQEMLQEYEGYVQKEQGEMEQKLNIFKEKQRLALEAFRANQATELQDYLVQLENRKTNLVNARAETLEKEREKLKQKSIQEKAYEMKLALRNRLGAKKSESLSYYLATVENLMNAAFHQQQIYIKNIQDEIESFSPKWMAEIREEEKANIERKELELREREIALNERRDNPSPKVKEEKHEDATINELREQIQAQQRQLNQVYGQTQQQMYHQATYQQPQPMQQPMQQPIYQQPQPMYQQPQPQQYPISQGQESSDRKGNWLKDFLFRTK